MALVPIRIGSATDIHQYDDGDFTEAIETTEPIAAGAPVNADHVVILSSLATYITSAAVLADHAIVRGDGGARGIQDSGITIDDTNNITLPDGVWLGLGVAKGRMVYNDEATDDITF